MIKTFANFDNKNKENKLDIDKFKNRHLFICAILVFIITIAFGNNTLSVWAMGNPNIECPTELIAKFEWDCSGNVDIDDDDSKDDKDSKDDDNSKDDKDSKDDDGCSNGWVFNGSADNANVVTILDNSDIFVQWSSAQEICSIIIKGGPNAVTLEPEAGLESFGFTGSFDNSELPKVGKGKNTPDLSNIQFCACSTTLITLVSFVVDIDRSGNVVLLWKTEAEIDNAGFNIWRSEDDGAKYVKINGSMIAAKGGSAWGADYSFKDKDVETGHEYSYLLEDLELDGDSALHGPIFITVDDKKRSRLIRR